MNIIYNINYISNFLIESTKGKLGELEPPSSYINKQLRWKWFRPGAGVEVKMFTGDVCLRLTGDHEFVSPWGPGLEGYFNFDHTSHQRVLAKDSISSYIKPSSVTPQTVKWYKAFVMTPLLLLYQDKRSRKNGKKTQEITRFRVNIYFIIYYLSIAYIITSVYYLHLLMTRILCLISIKWIRIFKIQ